MSSLISKFEPITVTQQKVVNERALAMSHFFWGTESEIIHIYHNKEPFETKQGLLEPPWDKLYNQIYNF